MSPRRDVGPGDAAPAASSVECPWCRGPMERGAVLGDRYRLQWQPDAKSMVLGIWSSGHGIGKWSWFSRPRVSGLRCARCSKIVLDESE